MPSRLFILTVLFLCACSSAPPEKSSVVIMTFNVENLFDTQHDDGKNDFTYLPLSTKSSQAHINRCQEIEVERWRNQCLYWDWSDRIVSEKLERIATAIRQIDEGADIIVFQEVENLRILQRLRDEYLSDLGYRTPILVEGNDDRGIDVAFLSKLPEIGKPRLHDIEFREISEEREADTRGILEASFRLPDGKLLTGYAVHFPAPYHPTPLREDAYITLNRLLAELPSDRLVFAAGDFNTTSTEDQNEHMLERYVDPAWHVTHRYCEGCKGTHYYARDDNWSFLDMVLLSKNFATTRGAGWWFDRESVALANDTPVQVTEQKTPARFQLPEPTGLSDHWPLVVTIREN